jgi:hypothetical protein
MNSTELINYLIHQRNAERYLEISVLDKQHYFVHIRCAHKTTSYPCDSNSFFSHNQEQFDIIFINGFHTEEQVLQDISNAYRILKKDGVIILHDCMPPDVWYQREASEYKNGEAWNGTVWKAVLRVFITSVYKCTLLDTDWGCGIIDTSLSQIPKLQELPETLVYEIHYSLLLSYKESVADYLRKQVQVFYHLACMGNWHEVYEEQIKQLHQSGFKQVNLTVLGTEEEIQKAITTGEEEGLKLNIIFCDARLTLFETPALLAIEAYAKEHTGYVLYLHSKGVSNPNDTTKIKWRRLMMSELVEKWESCMLQLPKYDTIGVNWRNMPPISHFCGNFWYASTNYLRKLADFKYYYDHPRYQIGDSIESKRLGCEFWISSGEETPQMLSLFCRNIDFCNPAYWIGK